MRYLIVLMTLVFLGGCAADGSFQMPNVMVKDKETGNLIGCKPVPERNVQQCDYEDGRFVFTVEIPMGAEPAPTLVPE
jgi:hypothetical protein